MVGSRFDQNCQRWVGFCRALRRDNTLDLIGQAHPGPGHTLPTPGDGPSNFLIDRKGRAAGLPERDPKLLGPLVGRVFATRDGNPRFVPWHASVVVVVVFFFALLLAAVGLYSELFPFLGLPFSSAASNSARARWLLHFASLRLAYFAWLTSLFNMTNIKTAL